MDKIFVKPVLLDRLIANYADKYTMKLKTKVAGKEFFKKPLPYYQGKYLRRLYHCWLVLRNKAIPFQFAEDWFKKGEEYYEVPLEDPIDWALKIIKDRENKNG